MFAVSTFATVRVEVNKSDKPADSHSHNNIGKRW